MLELALAVIGTSASGVLAPGPLFAANISQGMRHGARAGVRMAAGHAAVELPLVLLLGAGALSLGQVPGFHAAVSVLGAAALFAFAGLQLRDALRGRTAPAGAPRGPFLAGVTFSALNPFFLAWWMTVGLKLVSDAALVWAFWGALAVFALHIWMDFAWMGAVSLAASRARGVLSGRAYRAAMAGLAAVLVYFGMTFLAAV